MAIKTDINTMLLDEVFQIYTVAEQKLLTRIAKRVKRGVEEVGWTEEKFSDVQRIRKEAEAILENENRLAKSKISSGIIKSYLAGIASANKDHKLPKTILKEIVPEHIQRLILESYNLIDGTSLQILRNVNDVYRKVISEVSMNVLVGVDTRRQVAQDALNKFASNGITGFVDSIGRRWDMATYTEMATRTTTARAALQGHIDRQTEIGNDLIIVSSFGKTCPICAPWEGKVLSISGKTPGYMTLDQARAAGLFHPNCKHTITAYFPDIPGDNTPHQVEYDPEFYDNTQKQRYNERQIRKWKRVETVALSPVDQKRAQNKISFWQSRQRDLIRETGLKRKYGRENPFKAR